MARRPSRRSPWFRWAPVQRGVRLLLQRSPESLLGTVSRFALRESWKRERVHGICRAFLTGYNAMVAAEMPEHVHRVLDAVPSYYRPFAYEGAAMGFGPWAWLHGIGIEAFEATVHTLSPGSLYQNYVGLGWWLRLRRLPLRRIWEIACRCDYRYGIILYEGIGFSAGFLRAGDPGITAQFDRFALEPRHVCYQGYGRSLWFACMDALDTACERITSLDPAYRGDCFSGIGLGAAYSMLDRIEIFRAALAAIPEGHRPDFLQGAAFGWEARQLCDRAYFDVQMARLPAATREEIYEAIAAVHRCRDALEARGARGEFYQRWRELTRESLPAEETWLRIAL